MSIILVLLTLSILITEPHAQADNRHGSTDCSREDKVNEIQRLSVAISGLTKGRGIVIHGRDEGNTA